MVIFNQEGHEVHKKLSNLMKLNPLYLWERVRETSNPQRHFVLLALLLVMTFVVLKPVNAQSQTLTLGESFVLTLASENTLEDYAKLDLTPLKSQFYIDDSLQNRERVRLRLTPLQPGLVVIPPLQSGGIQTAQQTLDVLANPQVNINWQTPKPNAMQGEWALWQVQVELADAALPLQMIEPMDTKTQASIQPVQQTIDESKRSEFVQVSPLNQPGLVQVNAPIIQVTNRQGSRWIFSTAAVQVQVRALPAYLPANIAVGRFELQTERPFWLRSAQLHHAKYTLRGMNANLLADLRDQLGVLAAENLTPKISFSAALEPPGLVQQRLYEQAFRPNHLGFGQYPEIRIAFWDSERQKLNQLYLPTQTYLVLPSGVYWLFYGLAGLLILAGLVVAFWLSRISFYRVKLAWDLRQAKQQTNPPLAQWQAYQVWGKARGLGEPPTHQAWWSAYQNKFGKNANLEQKIKQLEQTLYQAPKP